MKTCIREELRKKIRETSLCGGEVLRSLDKAVEKLDQFVSILEPLQKTVSQIGEESEKIDKHLTEVKDQAVLVKEAYQISNELKSPNDSRSHLKNLERANYLMHYFGKNSQIPDARNIVDSISSALSAGYAACTKLIEEQLIKYNEIYSVCQIVQTNNAQVELINTIKELIEACKGKNSSYWASYVKLRSALLLKFSNVPLQIQSPYTKASHPVVTSLNKFMQCIQIESELLTSIIPNTVISEQVSEVVEPAFQLLNSITDQTLLKKSNISHLLDCLFHFNTALGKIEPLLGKGVKYYAISKIFTMILQKCQGWYRDYVGIIQTAKIEFGDNVHEMSASLARDLREVYLYSESVALAKLEQSVVNLITTLSDTYKIKIKAAGTKQQGLNSIFLINNMSFLINLMNDLGFSGNEDAMTRIEKDMLVEVEEYIKTTWAKLVPIISDPQKIIEFKKANVLTNRSRKEVKKKFDSFNSVFPEIFNFHKNFSIYNRDIMQLLRKKHLMTIVPSYKEFLTQYLAVDFTTRRDKYTLFPLETVERGLANMYSYKPLANN